MTVCSDCGMETAPRTGEIDPWEGLRRPGPKDVGKWEFYMVRNEIWQAVGSGRGFLCIGCLELRLGRVLKPRDFTSAEINDWSPLDTPRLVASKSKVQAVN
jgi:hypothetical protein